MYKAPIEIISSPPKFDIDGEIYKAVVKCGVSVDKDELIKALQYDRDQYDKGYADAKAEVAREIFEEIETCLYRPFDDMPGYVHYQIREQDYDEIKKKYTEGVT